MSPSAAKFWSRFEGNSDSFWIRYLETWPYWFPYRVLQRKSKLPISVVHIATYPHGIVWSIHLFCPPTFPILDIWSVDMYMENPCIYGLPNDSRLRVSSYFHIFLLSDTRPYMYRSAKQRSRMHRWEIINPTSNSMLSRISDRKKGIICTCATLGSPLCKLHC